MRVAPVANPEAARKGYDTCHGKWNLDSKRAAKDYATRLMKRPGSPALYVYACEFCSGFHVTKHDPAGYRAYKRRQSAGEA